jgi:hypothetical protein
MPRIFDNIDQSLLPALRQTVEVADRMPLPPLSEQERIATILEGQLTAVERTRKALKDQLDALDALPGALLRRAFSGEL